MKFLKLIEPFVHGSILSVPICYSMVGDWTIAILASATSFVCLSLLWWAFAWEEET